MAANKNPDFQKNLNVTKLLSPLSSVKVLHLKEDNYSADADAEKFLLHKNNVIEQSFNEQIILMDDNLEIKMNKIMYTQKGIQKEIAGKKVKIENE